MRALPIGLVLAAFSLAGCALSHLADSDAGPLGADAGPRLGCHPGDPAPFDAYCVFVGPDHVCGDAALSPTCIDRAWTCPAGTSSSASCWCSGLEPHDLSCVCTPSGWSCPPISVDAGLDAAPMCPADPSTWSGEPCTNEGATCGECVNPCGGSCNLIQCMSGVWQRPWFGCPAIEFACGPTMQCSQWTQYCQRVLSDVGGIPDDYTCIDFPSTCTHDCTCFTDAPGAGTCMLEPGSGVTVTLGGG